MIHLNLDPVDIEISKTYKKLDFILNTHHHNDHVGGNIDLKKNTIQKLFVLPMMKKKFLVQI